VKIGRDARKDGRTDEEAPGNNIRRVERLHRSGAVSPGDNYTSRSRRAWNRVMTGEY